MNWLINYFVNDPLRILYLIGGSGGITYWIGLYRNRIRIKVEFTKDRFITVNQFTLSNKAYFVIENIGKEKTSLQPKVKFTGYNYQLMRHSQNLEIPSTERTLIPFEPKDLCLEIESKNNYPFVFFRTYKFKLRKGFGKRIRIRSDNGEVFGFFKFYLFLSVFFSQRLFSIYCMKKS